MAEREGLPPQHGQRAEGTAYLLMLTNTAVFFICRKKSLLQSPLVAGVKEQATMMKSDSAASLGVDTGGGRGSIKCRLPGWRQQKGGQPELVLAFLC